MNIDQTIAQIHIEDIIPNRFQPRLNFDEEGLKELSESIKEHGIIQPLVLRKLGDKYEIIAGERRYKAATMAGLTTVPAVIKNIDDNMAAEEAIVENVQRRNLTAIEEARSYKNLLDKGYLTQEGLAKKMGLSQSAISNKLRLLNLDDEVQQALLDEKISERHARTLLSIPDKEAQKEWLHRIINERLTVRQLDLELKKSNTKVADALNEEDLGVPLVNSKPSIDEIKANATDIHDSNKMSVEDMMKPTETLNEEIETLDLNDDSNSSKSDNSSSDPGEEIIDFGKHDDSIIETPKSTENSTFDTEIIQNSNDNKFFNFAPIDDEQIDIKEAKEDDNTFVSDNSNGFEIIDDTKDENSEIKNMSNDLSQENPFTAAEENTNTFVIDDQKENENSFVIDDQKENNSNKFFNNIDDNSDSINSINISSNNKFFTPTIEETQNNVIINNQEEEMVNPMDRVADLDPNTQEQQGSEEALSLKDTINEIRKTIENLGNKGVYVEVEELDFEDNYQINIKIPKDN